MTDGQRWTPADISQSRRCFETSDRDTCQPQSRTPSTLPPKRTRKREALPLHMSDGCIRLVENLFCGSYDAKGSLALSPTHIETRMQGFRELHFRL